MANKSAPFETTTTGFWMTFENGYSISVQWGTANYCTNKSFDNPNKGKLGNSLVSQTAEIAIINEYGNFIDLTSAPYDYGWCTPEQVLEWMEYCKSLPIIFTQDKPEEGTITP